MAKRSLGQHFLRDANYCHKIVRFAGVRPEETVLEIGAGTGQLTRALLDAARQVTALEFDSEMIQVLKETLAGHLKSGRLRLIQANILSVDWNDVLGDPPVKIVGNLPYNISIRTLKRMTQIGNRFQSATVMLQREVARRVLAQPGQSEYSYFTLLMQHHFVRHKGFDVPPGVFVPRPRVVSHVLKLIPVSQQMRPEETQELMAFISMAFRQRRKTLANNLGREGRVPQLEEAFRACNIALRSRPQALSLEQYHCLWQRLSRSSSPPAGEHVED